MVFLLDDYFEDKASVLAKKNASESYIASALLAALVDSGVKNFVLAPGSRSQSFALVAAQLELDNKINLHVIHDERMAGFFALGLAKETSHVVVIITTSGSAVSHLHPAVLEADAAGIPLIVISADRPAFMRGIRSSQTTRQAHIFTKTSRFSVDSSVPELVRDKGLSFALSAFYRIAKQAVFYAQGSLSGHYSGPVHLNIGLDKPLSGEIVTLSTPNFDEDFNIEYLLKLDYFTIYYSNNIPVAKLAYVYNDIKKLDSYSPSDLLNTVVVAGYNAYEQAQHYAQDASLPLFAEIVSGSRFSKNSISYYRELLRNDFYREKIKRVILFGQPTLSAEIISLCQDPKIELIVVSDHGAETPNPGRNAKIITTNIAKPDTKWLKNNHEWLGLWVLASRELLAENSKIHQSDVSSASDNDYKKRSEYAKKELLALKENISREMLVDYLWYYSWPKDRVIFASSRIVRIADERLPGKKNKVYSNRGLAGIDGTIAFSFGVGCAATQSPNYAGTIRLITGDLAFIHDISSLYLRENYLDIPLQIFVVDDGGGSIFDSLPVAESAPSHLYNRVMFAPHSLSLDKVAEGFSWQVRNIFTRSDLIEVLSVKPSSPEIVIMKMSR